jgi:hypothetical protein
MPRSSPKDPVSRNLAYEDGFPERAVSPGGHLFEKRLVESVRGLVQAQSARGDDIDRSFLDEKYSALLGTPLAVGGLRSLTKKRFSLQKSLLLHQRRLLCVAFCGF